MVQFRARSPAIVGLFSEPLGTNFDPAAAGLAAARPIGPLTQFAVRRTGDDAGLFNVPCKQSRNKQTSVQNRCFATGVVKGHTISKLLLEWKCFCILVRMQIAFVWFSFYI